MAGDDESGAGRCTVSSTPKPSKHLAISFDGNTLDCPLEPLPKKVRKHITKAIASGEANQDTRLVLGALVELRRDLAQRVYFLEEERGQKNLARRSSEKKKDLRFRAIWLLNRITDYLHKRQALSLIHI